MQYTPNYNLIIAEGADAVNPLTQIFPNFTAIDTAMEDNKEAGITTASEVTTGGVHAIVRVDSSVPVFRYTATSAWTTGDTMTLDGSAVTVHLADGTAPKSGAYVIGAEVLAIVNGSLVTLMTGASFDGVVSFNSRQGVVTPQSGDYTANMIGYNNTASGLSATDIQSAVDEVVNMIPSGTSVSVTADGTKTYKQLFDTLFSLVDPAKITKKATLSNDQGTIYVCGFINATNYIFFSESMNASVAYINQYSVSDGTSSAYLMNVTANTIQDLSNSVVNAGIVWTVTY